MELLYIFVESASVEPQMHCHLATCVFQKPQDKNDGSGDELQKKEEEDAQKPPLYEEQAQHSAKVVKCQMRVFEL